MIILYNVIGLVLGVFCLLYIFKNTNKLLVCSNNNNNRNSLLENTVALIVVAIEGLLLLLYGILTMYHG